MISCGEPSGEIYAAGIVDALRKKLPEAEVLGLGGDLLAQRDVRLVGRYGELAVIGLAEALRGLGRARALLRRLAEAMDAWRPQVLICVDFKEFNLSLAKAAHRRGIPVVFFVGPQLWAWRPGRAKVYARYVEKLALLFPFETKYYEGLPIDARFVGHPSAWLAKTAKAADVRQAGLDPDHPLLLLQPGSRAREIAQLGPVMLAAWRLLRAEFPKLQAAVLAPAHLAHPFYDEAQAQGVPVVRADGMAWRKAAAASLVASGTAALETAMAGTPGAILYKLSPLSFWLGKRLVRVPYVGMPNILLGEEAMPELLQDEATPERAAQAVRPWIADSAARKASSEKLAALAEMLDTGRSPLYQVAEMAIEAMQGAG